MTGLDRYGIMWLRALANDIVRHEAGEALARAWRKYSGTWHD